MGAGVWTQVFLIIQQALLPTEPSLQPLFIYLTFFHFYFEAGSHYDI